MSTIKPASSPAASPPVLVARAEGRPPPTPPPAIDSFDRVAKPAEVAALLAQSASPEKSGRPFGRRPVRPAEARVAGPRVCDLRDRPAGPEHVFGRDWQEQIRQGAIRAEHLPDYSIYYLRARDNRGALVPQPYDDVDIRPDRVTITNLAAGMEATIELDPGAVLTILPPARDEGTELIDRGYVPAAEKVAADRAAFVDTCVAAGNRATSCDVMASEAEAGAPDDRRR